MVPACFVFDQFMQYGLIVVISSTAIHPYSKILNPLPGPPRSQAAARAQPTRLTSARLAPISMSTEPNTRFWLRRARTERSSVCRREASHA